MTFLWFNRTGEKPFYLFKTSLVMYYVIFEPRRLNEFVYDSYGQGLGVTCCWSAPLRCGQMKLLSYRCCKYIYHFPGNERRERQGLTCNSAWSRKGWGGILRPSQVCTKVFNGLIHSRRVQLGGGGGGRTSSLKTGSHAGQPTLTGQVSG